MGSAHHSDFATTFADTNADWIGGDPSLHRFAIDEIVLKSGDTIRPQRAGVTAIVGANNAGKSTILRELSEVLHHHPTNPQPPHLSVDSVKLSTEGGVADFFSWLDRNSTFTRQGESMGFVRPGASFLVARSAAHFWQSRDRGLASLAPFLCFYGNASGRFSIGGSVEMRDSVDDPPNHPVHYLQDSLELRERVSAIAEEVFQKPLTLDALAKTVRLRVGAVDMEAPRVDDIPREYREAIASLMPLDEQGDGMKGFFGQILPVVTATYPLVILDEPEAFLHPPQAHALGVELGRLAVQREIQILVATHDRNLLTGLLESGVAVSIVRASRSNTAARTFQLDAEELRALWNDPVLKYSNVLDGLFHRVVVLAEAEGDCAYMAAGLDCSNRGKSPIPSNEILFVPTGGKAAIRKVAGALDAVKVPVIAAPDLDMLSDQVELERLIVAVGGEWSTQAQGLWNSATAAQRAPREPVKVEYVLNAINAAFKDRSDESYTGDVREELLAQARSRPSPWVEVKEYGIDAFKGEARVAAVELLDLLEKSGVVLVRDGELERMAPEVPARKGPGWLQMALSLNAQCNDRTQAHLDRILAAGVRMLEAQTDSGIVREEADS